MSIPAGLVLRKKPSIVVPPPRGRLSLVPPVAPVIPDALPLTVPMPGASPAPLARYTSNENEPDADQQQQKPGRAFLMAALDRIGSAVTSAHERARAEGRPIAPLDFVLGASQRSGIVVPSPLHEYGHTYPTEQQAQDVPYVTGKDASRLSDEEQQNLVWGKITPEELAARRMEAQQGTDALKAEETARTSGIVSPAVGQGAALQAPAPSSAASSIVVPPPPSRLARHEERINELLDKLDALENNPTHPQHGRAVSALIGALQGLATGGVGGAIAGGVLGAASPKTIQRIQDHAQALKLRGQINEAVKLEQMITNIEHVQSETARNQAVLSGTNTEAKERAALVKELTSRMRVTGNRLDTKTDPRQGEIAAKLGISTSFGGARFNPNAVRTLRGSDGVDRAVYFRMAGGKVEGQYIDVNGNPGEALSERDKRNLALDLERENRQRAEDNLPPLKFNDGLNVPLPAPAGRIRTVEQGQEVGDSFDESTPSGIVVPPAPSMLVSTGAPPAKITSQFRRRGGNGGGARRAGGSYSSSSDEKGRSISYNKAASSIERVEQLRTQADAYYQRGQYDRADASLSEANAIADTLSKNPNTRGLVNITYGQDHRNKRWPKVTLAGDAQPSTQGSQSARRAPARMPRSNLPEAARRLGMTEQQAEQHLRSQGVEIY